MSLLPTGTRRWGRLTTILALQGQMIGGVMAATVLVWILGTGFILHELLLSESQRPYLCSYAWSSMWAHSCPSLAVGLGGNSVAAGDAAQLLEERVFRAPFGVLLRRAAIYSLAPTGGFVAVIFLYVWRREDAEEGGRHIRGTRVVEPPALGRMLQDPKYLDRGRIGRFVRALVTRTEGEGVPIGGVRLSRKQEFQHVMLVGAPGTGKSTIIRGILREVDRRGDGAVVYDPEGEFVAEFYRPDRGDIILNPLDDRAPVWSPWDELHHFAEADALAESFLPDPPNPTGNERFFLAAARELLKSLLTKIESKDPREIYVAALREGSDLHNFVRGESGAAFVSPRAAQMAASVQADLMIAAASLRLLPRDDGRRPRWSAAEWIRDRRGWVFLTAPEAARKAVLILISVWLDCITRRVLETELATAQERATWIVADELQTLRRQMSVENLLARGRKRGAVVVTGFQTITQMRTIYGKEGAGTLAALPRTHYFSRVTEPDTAQWVSQAIGQREIERYVESVTGGTWAGRDSVNERVERRVEDAVLPAEIRGLPDFTGYLSVGGLGAVAKVSLPRLDPLRNHPSFIPRTGAEAEAAEVASLIGRIEAEEPPERAPEPDPERVPSRDVRRL